MGASAAVFLSQIVVLLVVGRLLGELLSRWGQPPIMGQLLAGVVLGPSVLGLLSPAAELALFPHAPPQRAMLDSVAQLGILLLLLVTGMETDLSVMRNCGRAALSVSLAGIALRQALLMRRHVKRVRPAIDQELADAISSRMTGIADDGLRAALGRLGAAIKRT